MAPDRTDLNEDQVRYLRVSCQHIDTLLGGIEGALHESASGTAFPRYRSDITPAQRRTIEDYIARIRAQLLRVLDGQGIPRDQPSIPASRTVRTSLAFVDIAVTELKPKYLQHYGDLSQAATTEIHGIVGELHGLVTRLDRYLTEGVGQDLGTRLRRLEQAGNDLHLLADIEQVVAERGLVEFRGTIASILDRAEDRTFEIAVFGRVSAGKSSLLNAVLGTDVLPVGVTPVTAVPTRITLGESPSVTVSFAQGDPQTLAIGRLGEFTTEEQNPKNKKQVTRVTVSLPASRLRDGITFVDTPGLGSLATSGAAETLAYLPRCDLGIVLIDAGSTLTAEDIRTILALLEAAIPVNVLVSKADLLTGEDAEKIMDYVKRQIASEAGQDLAVYPVSVRPSHRHLLDQWFTDQILPLSSRSQELRASSMQRKIGALRESVISTLQIRLCQSQRSPSGSHEDVRDVEARLRRATGLIEETRAACEQGLGEGADVLSEICQTVAAGVMGTSRDADQGSAVDDMIRMVFLQYAQQRAKEFQDAVEGLAHSLQDELVQGAVDLGAADMPGEDELLSLVRGMPAFDPGTISVDNSPSVPAILFGGCFAERHLEKQISRHITDIFRGAYTHYGDHLREWARLMTGQLGQRFETYAERYRALAEELLREQKLTVEEIHAIEESIQLLQGHESDGVAVVGQITGSSCIPQ